VEDSDGQVHASSTFPPATFLPSWYEHQLVDMSAHALNILTQPTPRCASPTCTYVVLDSERMRESLRGKSRSRRPCALAHAPHERCLGFRRVE
jgi:hypothetical protein